MKTVSIQKVMSAWCHSLCHHNFGTQTWVMIQEIYDFCTANVNATYQINHVSCLMAVPHLICNTFFIIQHLFARKRPEIASYGSKIKTSWDWLVGITAVGAAGIVLGASSRCHISHIFMSDITCPLHVLLKRWGHLFKWIIVFGASASLD